jgi:hypothetical protein
MDWFYKALQGWEEYYYTEPFEIMCLAVALITGVAFAKKHLVRNFFVFYALIGLLSMGYQIYITHILALAPSRRSIHICLLNLAVSYIELGVFMVFFYNILINKAIKTFIKLSFVSITLINIFLFYKVLFPEISADNLSRASIILIPLQLLPVLFICFCYYYQILHIKSGDDLFNRPSFWITNSIFFYILLLTPFTLIYDKLKTDYRHLFTIFFSIHYLSFAIIFIALINAFLCKKPITT